MLQFSFYAVFCCQSSIFDANNLSYLVFQAIMYKYVCELWGTSCKVGEQECL